MFGGFEGRVIGRGIRWWRWMGGSWWFVFGIYVVGGGIVVCCLL